MEFDDMVDIRFDWPIMSDAEIEAYNLKTFSQTEDTKRGYTLEERVNLECRMSSEGWD